jgi:N-hydroxyarylamine O-acetyltransferase
VKFENAAWLADVGFGGNGLVEAIPFVFDREFEQTLDCYRLVEDAAYGCRLEHRLPAGWRTLYAFSLDPYLGADFRLLNYGICRSPASIFTQIPICVRTTASDRRMIVANQFKTRSVGGATVTTLETSAQLRDTLAEHLGIRIPAGCALPDPPSAPAGMRAI